VNANAAKLCKAGISQEACPVAGTPEV